MDRGWRFRLADPSLPGEAGKPVGGWKYKPVEGVPPAAVPTVDDTWKDVAPGVDTFAGRQGFCWYAAILPPSAATAGNVLTFDGVDDNCTVFLNGKKLATHEGWAESFDVPLDPAWNPAGDNTLVVLVENTFGI